MRKVEIQTQTHLEIDGIEGFFIRKVTKSGNSAKVDCPNEGVSFKEFLLGLYEFCKSRNYKSEGS